MASVVTNGTSTQDISEIDLGVGLSDAHLAISRRKLLDLVNRLQSTGVAQTDIDIPQIAVIGSQSAGKSSLIEAISGITLPRAAGTCTRCPTECLLKGSTSPWQCKVTLRFVNDKTGQPLGQARNEEFGPIIYDKALVEERIRRAQFAILNPSMPVDKFLQGSIQDLSESSELTFSKNVVSLSISGPGVADLSFCDLPGLIASVSSGRGGSGDIALVESLVTSYISKPSCIILLTVACETDFENQGAHHLTKIHDPEGVRTIGVLTKPDRIPTGEEKAWVDFIKNDREHLVNNWFCVKQPSSSELKDNITWAIARQREDDFFATTRPWSDLSPIYHRYLRTENLVQRLSTVLSDLISKRLPEILEEIERGIANTRAAIKKLPPAPSSDPLSDIASVIHLFTSDLREHVMGIPETNGLLQTIAPIQQSFRKGIRKTTPLFVPFSRKQFESRSLPPVKFLDNEEEAEPLLPTTARPVKRSSVSSSASDMDLGNTDKEDDPEERIVYIDEVISLAREWRTRELPGVYPYVVQKHLISRSTSRWGSPAVQYLNRVHSILTQSTQDLITRRFRNVGRGLLENRVSAIFAAHLRECFQRTEQRLELLLEVEELPFTLNSHYLSDYKSKFLTYYREARENVVRENVAKQIKTYIDDPSSRTTSTYNNRLGRNEVVDSSPMAKAISALAEMGITGIRPEDLYKILPEDEMAPALSIMADVRAYFQVAYKRYADMVPMVVDHGLIRGVDRDILGVLYTKLGIAGPEGHQVAKELVEEDRHIADGRMELTKKLERLHNASTELLKIRI